jgi:hypothetical protein
MYITSLAAIHEPTSISSLEGLKMNESMVGKSLDYTETYFSNTDSTQNANSLMQAQDAQRRPKSCAYGRHAQQNQQHVKIRVYEKKKR